VQKIKVEVGEKQTRNHNSKIVLKQFRDIFHYELRFTGTQFGKLALIIAMNVTSKSSQ